MLFIDIEPQSLINFEKKTPENGRLSWTAEGKANNLWNYGYIVGAPKIGTNAEKSLEAWSVCAGSWSYQSILMKEGFLRELDGPELGIFGPATKAAVQAMQRAHTDPATGRKLDPDGTIGRSDSRALLTPIIDAAERKYKIPLHYLRGEINLESSLDAGALGWVIWYGADKEYRGVDRGLCQINTLHKEVGWGRAYNPYFAIDWSANFMREAFDDYVRRYPDRNRNILWDAAICHHNNPSAALSWARDGAPPTTQAASYVNFVKRSIY